MANGINTWKQFDTARENFKNDQKDGRKATLSQKIADAVDTEKSDKTNIIYMAVEWGYGDAARNMHGIGEYKTKKKDALEEIADELKTYFKNQKAPKNYDEFNDKHTKLCEKWTGKFDDQLAFYGKAQKIVNMAFKYLYCCADADDYSKKENDYFKYCHVPLDTFTLEWFRHEWFLRKTRGAGEPTYEMARLPWSSIKDYDAYIEFQNCFREWYENEEITPLQAEFIYWPLVK